MKLINTIEINPLQYSKEEFELPEVSEYPDPEEWFMKWEELASKLNFNFNCIEKGSHLVDIETIVDENLQIIVDAKVKDIEEDTEEGDFVMAFDGGITLKTDNEIVIRPTCCGDMSNTENWQNIFKNQSLEWTELWIGHPWVLYRKENGKISFSEYTEKNSSEPENIKILVEVDEAELKAELEKVIEYQINFKNRIAEMLKKMNIKNAERMAQLMAGVCSIKL